MNDGKFHDLFEYRKAIISDSGPDSATMRHVLLTLSQFMDEDLYCYPSIKTLAAATALNERTVRNQLQEAVHDGWIERKIKGINGKGWKLYDYIGAIPERAEFITAPSVDNSLINAELSDPDSERAERRSITYGTSFHNVRAHDPTNRSENRSENTGNFIFEIDDMFNKNNIEIDKKFNPFIALLVNKGVSSNKDQAKRSVIAWLNSKGEETVYGAYLKTKNISEDYSQNLYNALRSNVK